MEEQLWGRCQKFQEHPFKARRAPKFLGPTISILGTFPHPFFFVFFVCVLVQNPGSTINTNRYMIRSTLKIAGGVETLGDSGGVLQFLRVVSRDEMAIPETVLEKQKQVI